MDGVGWLTGEGLEVYSYMDRLNLRRKFLKKFSCLTPWCDLRFDRAVRHNLH